MYNFKLYLILSISINQISDVICHATRNEGIVKIEHVNTE